MIKYSWDKLIGKEVSALCVSTTALIIIYISGYNDYDILDNTALLTQFHITLLAYFEFTLRLIFCNEKPSEFLLKR